MSQYEEKMRCYSAMHLVADQRVFIGHGEEEEELRSWANSHLTGAYEVGRSIGKSRTKVKAEFMRQRRALKAADFSQQSRDIHFCATGEEEES